MNSTFASGSTKYPTAKPSPPDTMNHASIGLVDDDPGILKSLGRLLTSRGFNVTKFSSAKVFLKDPELSNLDCVILDLSLPGKNGFEVQDQLSERGLNFPVIFLSGEGDIPSSVRAIKAGAINFLTKPVEASDLIETIDLALRESTGKRTKKHEVDCLKTKFESLTSRELEILRHVIAGKLNKQIAGDLGISEQTVKIHRMHITGKTGLPSVAELVRAAGELGHQPAV